MTTNPLFEMITETHPNDVAHWVCTEHGRETITIARYRKYKNEKTYRQFFNDGHGWKLGLPPLPYPLYGLNTLHNKFPYDGILICEAMSLKDNLTSLIKLAMKVTEVLCCSVGQDFIITMKTE